MEQGEKENYVAPMSKYKREYCLDLIEWMAKGRSYGTWGVMREPRLHPSTQYDWEKKHPEWKEAKEIGYACALAFFEELLLAATTGVVPKSLQLQGSKGVDIKAVVFALKTRFHKEYGDISKIEHSGQIEAIREMTKEERLEMLNEYRNKIQNEDYE